MSTMRLSTATESARDNALEEATLAIRRGELVVMPTDTVYGVAADAFEGEAVARLLAAKGRGRDMPPPVLVSSATTLDALATDVPEFARKLVEEFWPGPLTLVCHQQPSLSWDLGDNMGTVAVRMPEHEVALALLERTGPLAVSSANTTGLPAALDMDQAEQMFGDRVSVYLDAGAVEDTLASTIVDVTGPTARVLRLGLLGVDDLRRVLDPLDVVLEGQGVPEVAQEPDGEPAAEA